MPRRNSKAGGLNRNVRKHRKLGVDKKGRKHDANRAAPLTPFQLHPPKRPAR